MSLLEALGKASAATLFKVEGKEIIVSFGQLLSPHGITSAGRAVIPSSKSTLVKELQSKTNFAPMVVREPGSRKLVNVLQESKALEPRLVNPLGRVMLLKEHSWKACAPIEVKVEGNEMAFNETSPEKT